MKSFIKRPVSILLLLALTLDSTSARTIAAFNFTAERFRMGAPSLSIFGLQTICPKLESDHFAKGFSRLSETTPAAFRYFHRPGKTILKAARILKIIPGPAYERFQNWFKFLMGLHDELAQPPKDEYRRIPNALKGEWEAQTRDIAGIRVEIVFDDEAQERLGTLKDVEGDFTYIPISKIEIKEPDIQIGHRYNPTTIFIKESIYRIPDVKLRRRVLGMVIGHEKAEIWIQTEKDRFLVRVLLAATRLFGANSAESQIEKLAKGLMFLYYWRIRGKLKRLVKTPPIDFSTLKNLYLRRKPADWELHLLEGAYQVMEKSYRPSNKDKEYPSGESYSSKATRDTRDLILLGASATTIAAALLQEIPESEMPGLHARLQAVFLDYAWLHPDKVAEICGLIGGLNLLQKQPSNLRLRKDRPNFAIQYQSNFEIQLIRLVANDFKVPYPSLLNLTMVENSNSLPTIDPISQKGQLDRTSSLMQFVLAPLAERHGRGRLARELANAVFKIQDPTAYEDTRTAFRKRLGMSHAQVQTLIPSIAKRLDEVVRTQYGIEPAVLPLGTSPLGGDNPNGREKWYWSSAQKGIGDTPIPGQMDLAGWMVVVQTPEEVERLRHGLDEDISTDKLPTKRVRERAPRVIRGPDGRIVYQLANFEFENPYLPGHTVVAELQIMTAEYHFRHYISGQSPAAYRYPHWWVEAKRDADIKAFGKHKISYGEGQQFNQRDPLLSGNFDQDAEAIADHVDRDVEAKADDRQEHVYVDVATSRIPIANQTLKENDLEAVEWDPLHLRNHARGADVVFHPNVGGHLNSRPKLWRLVPAPSRLPPGGEIVYNLEPIALSDAIKRGDTIVVDQANETDALDTTALLNLATSPWAHLALRDLDKASSDYERRSNLVQEGRKSMVGNLEREEQTRYQDAVIKPLADALDFLDLDDFYVAIALAERDKRANKTAQNSPFIQLQKDYDAHLVRQFVQYGAFTYKHDDDIIVRLKFDEDQIGILADVLRILRQNGEEVVAWEQHTSTPGEGIIRINLGRAPANLTLEQFKDKSNKIENALKAGLFRRRGERVPPEDGRRLQVNFEITRHAGRNALESFADTMQRLDIDIEEGHPEKDLGDDAYSCTLVVPRLKEKKGQERNARILIEQTMSDLQDRGIIRRFDIHDAPMTDSTRQELLAMMQRERSAIPEEFAGEFPVEQQTPLPPDFIPIKIEGPIDDGLVSDVYRALRLSYRYLGHPNPAIRNVWAKRQIRRTGAPFAVNSMAATYALILESRQRHTRTILRQFLYAAVRKGPENVWRLMAEDVLPELTLRLSEGKASQDQLRAILRRLKDRFKTIDAETWIAAAHIPLEIRASAPIMDNLHRNILTLAGAEIENQILADFPMYGQELIEAIKKLDASPAEMLVQNSTISREAAKMAEAEQELRTHEDASILVPQTLYEFLPLIMHRARAEMNPEDYEEYIFSRRHLLHTLILRTNELSALVPYVKPGESLELVQSNLRWYVSGFIAFKSDPRNQPIFDNLVDPVQRSVFDRRLEELVKFLNASLETSGHAEESIPFPPGVDPAFAAAFGSPDPPINEATAAALMKYLIRVARTSPLPKSAWTILPIQPYSHEADLWFLSDIPGEDRAFLKNFETVWDISKTHISEPHMAAVIMELLNNVHMRDPDALLAGVALRLFENALASAAGDLRGLEPIRARLRENLPPTVAERLIANIQMTTRGFDQTYENFDSIKRYGSNGLKAAKAIDVAIQLHSARNKSRAWADALRFLTVLVPDSVETGRYDFWAIRRYVALLISAQGSLTRLSMRGKLSTRAKARVEAILGEAVLAARAFWDWAQTPKGQDFLPHELGDALAIFLERLSQLSIAKRPPMLTKEELNTGLKQAILYAYIATAFSFALAFITGHFSHSAALGAILTAYLNLFLLPALLAFLAWGLGIGIHEWLGHIREAKKSHRNVELINYWGNLVVVGIPNSRSVEETDPYYNFPSVIDNDDVLAAGPQASRIALTIGSVFAFAAAIAYYLNITPPIFQGQLHSTDLFALAVRWALLTFLISATRVNAIFSSADRSPITIPTYELGDNLAVRILRIRPPHEMDAAGLLSHILSLLRDYYEIGRRLSIQRFKDGGADVTISIVQDASLTQFNRFDIVLDQAETSFTEDPSQRMPIKVGTLHRRRLLLRLTHPADLAKAIDLLHSSGVWIEGIRPTLYEGKAYYLCELAGPEAIADLHRTEQMRQQLTQRWGARDVQLVDYVAPEVKVVPEITGHPFENIYNVRVRDLFHQPATLSRITTALVENGCFILEYDQQPNADDGATEIVFKVRHSPAFQRINLEKMEVYPSRVLPQKKARSLTINFYLQDVSGAFDQIAKALTELNVQVERGHQDTYVKGQSKRMVELRVSMPPAGIEELKNKLLLLKYTNVEEGEFWEYPLVANLEIAAENISETDAARAANHILKQIESASSGDKTVLEPTSLEPEAPLPFNDEFTNNTKKGLEILNLANADPDTVGRPREAFRWIPSWVEAGLKSILPPEWYVSWLCPEWLPTVPQLRKANDEPYVLHPKRTAYNLLARGILNAILIITALLHDAIEDAGKNAWAAMEEVCLDAADPEKRIDPKIQRKQRELLVRYRRHFEHNPSKRNLLPEMEWLIALFKDLPPSTEEAVPGETPSQKFARLVKKLDWLNTQAGLPRPSPRIERLQTALMAEAKELVKSRIMRIRSYPTIVLHYIEILSNDDDYERYAKDLIERGLSDLLLIKFEEQRDNLRSIWQVEKKSPSFPSKSIAKNIRYIAPIAFSPKYVKNPIAKNLLIDYFETLINQSCVKDSEGAYKLTSLPVYYERNKRTGATESVETSRAKMIDSMRIIREGLRDPRNADFLPKNIAPEDMAHFISLLESTPLDAPTETETPPDDPSGNLLNGSASQTTGSPAERLNPTPPVTFLDLLGDVVRVMLGAHHVRMQLAMAA